MKIWSHKRYHIGFKLEAKKIPKRYQKLEFQTLKDTTSTHTILPYKNTRGSGISAESFLDFCDLNTQSFFTLFYIFF